MLSVLTGDFIASRHWAPAQTTRAHEVLRAEADRIARWAGGLTAYTRNRGDGWQMVLHRPILDLRAALALRATIKAEGKGFDTRIAIARGAGTIAGQDLNAAHGPAFSDAGHALDTMDPELTLVHTDTGALGAATSLADALSRDWTPAQSRALRPMLAPDPPTHADVAQTLGISRSAVSQALAAVRFDHISRALAAIETET